MGSVVRPSVDMCQAAFTDAHLPQHARGVPHGRFHPAGQPEASEHAMEDRHDSRAPLLEGRSIVAHRYGGRRAGKKELASTDAGRFNIQCFSLYANESRIEISALSKRYIHVEKVGSGAGGRGAGWHL